MSLVRGVLEDGTGKLAVVWFNRPYLVHQVAAGDEYVLHGAVREGKSGLELLNPSCERADEDAQDGPIVPVYPPVGGVGPAALRKIFDGVLPWVDFSQVSETLPRELLDRYGLPGLGESLQALHRPGDSASVLDRTPWHLRLLYGELFELQLTLALLRTLHFPVSITALDLSATSISAAKKAVAESPGRTRDVTFAEGNLLSLPFFDNSLDLVVTSGALEYVPLGEGMAELSRVIASGGHLLHIPCRPSPATTFLEILFRFKKHPRKEVLRQTEQHFRMVHEFRFPPLQIIGWSKTAILAQKL